MWYVWFGFGGGGVVVGGMVVVGQYGFFGVLELYYYGQQDYQLNQIFYVRI